MKQPVKPLRFDRIEGPNIYAIDAEGEPFYVQAEMFPGWDDIPFEVIQSQTTPIEPYVEKYVLPEVQQNWNLLVWFPA